MSNKVLGQYTLLSDIPTDSLFYTVVSGVAYKTTLGAIQTGLNLSVLDLSDTPSSYATTSSRSDPTKYYFLSVNSAGNATQFAQVRFTDLLQVPSTISALESDIYGQKFLGVGNGDTSITAQYVDFTGLQDTPSSYSSASLKLVRVNSAANAIEFVDSSSVFTQTTGFTELNDTPNSYAGHGGKYVKVTADATGLEFTSSISSTASVACGETLNLSIPTASSASEAGSFPYPKILLQQDNGNYYAVSSWMKPTGFDSGQDVTLDVTFIGQEHASLNPRYYYNIYCVTGTDGGTVMDNPTTGLSPLITDYVDMTSAATNTLKRKRHTFNAALSSDVSALYFWIERTNGTSGAENASGVNLNGLGITYYQNAI